MTVLASVLASFSVLPLLLRPVASIPVNAGCYRINDLQQFGTAEPWDNFWNWNSGQNPSKTVIAVPTANEAEAFARSGTTLLRFVVETQWYQQGSDPITLCWENYIQNKVYPNAQNCYHVWELTPVGATEPWENFWGWHGRFKLDGSDNPWICPPGTGGCANNRDGIVRASIGGAAPFAKTGDGVLLSFGKLFKDSNAMAECQAEAVPTRPAPQPCSGGACQKFTCAANACDDAAAAAGDFGTYTGGGYDCNWCMEQCANDVNCGSVECGPQVNACRWWKQGACTAEKRTVVASNNQAAYTCSAEVTDIDCSNLSYPSLDEVLANYCQVGELDILYESYQSTESTSLDVQITTSTEATTTRSTQRAFTQTHSFDWSAMDSSMSSVTDATNTKLSDPAISVGYKEAKAGDSCFNENSAGCLAKDVPGVQKVAGFAEGGLGGMVSGLFGRRRRLGFLDGLFGGGNDDDKCKCKEQTDTHTTQTQTTHQTTVGQTKSQSTAVQDTFTDSQKDVFTQAVSYTCPEYTDCWTGAWTVSNACAIPYWGTCTVTYASGFQSSVTLDRDDDNQRWLYVSSYLTYKDFGPITTKKKTSGENCGVQLTPAVRGTDDDKICPEAGLGDMPNCDCMMAPYQDCETGTHRKRYLSVGDVCVSGNRPDGELDMNICLQSKSEWLNVSNCLGADVMTVTDYDQTVYNALKSAIDATPLKEGNVCKTVDPNTGVVVDESDKCDQGLVCTELDSDPTYSTCLPANSEDLTNVLIDDVVTTNDADDDADDTPTSASHATGIELLIVFITLYTTMRV